MQNKDTFFKEKMTLDSNRSLYKNEMETTFQNALNNC